MSNREFWHEWGFTEFSEMVAVHNDSQKGDE